MVSMQRVRDHSIDRMAVKALVAVYGPREAARQSGLPTGTVLGWCAKFKWKKADRIVRGTRAHENNPMTGKDPAQVLTEALQNHKDESTLHLAKYVEKASKAASKSEKPLEVARQVRDVSQVYKTLYPPEEGGEMIEGAILVGGMKVKDDPQEMLANVRQELPDQRPAGD